MGLDNFATNKALAQYPPPPSMNTVYAGCLHTIQIGMSHISCMQATPTHPHKMHACMLTPSTLGCMYAYVHCACSVCVCDHHTAC
jgi:hypothetical protein